MEEKDGPAPGYNHRHEEDPDERFKRQADYLARQTGEETYNAFFGGRVDGGALLFIIFGTVGSALLMVWGIIAAMNAGWFG